MIRALPCVAGLLLAGCGTAPPAPDCSPGDLEQAALQAVSAGSGPEAMSAGLSYCRSSQEAMGASWDALACSPEGGWRLGMAGADQPERCGSVDRWWREGHQLGSAYRQIRLRLSDAEQSLASGQALSSARFEQVKLTRERDNIRGIAQIKGWPLPEGDLPATNPDKDQTP